MSVESASRIDSFDNFPIPIDNNPYIVTMDLAFCKDVAGVLNRIGANEITSGIRPNDTTQPKDALDILMLEFNVKSWMNDGSDMRKIILTGALLSAAFYHFDTFLSQATLEPLEIEEKKRIMDSLKNLYFDKRIQNLRGDGLFGRLTSVHRFEGWQDFVRSR